MASAVVQRIQDGLLALKRESTFGTDIFAGTIAADDVIPAYNITIAPSRPLTEVRPQSGLYGETVPDVPGSASATITFNMRLRGKGTAYAAISDIESELPLVACGQKLVVDATPASEKITVTPQDLGSLFESVTAYIVRRNGYAHKLVGVQGDAVIAMIGGQPWELQCTLTGALLPEAAVTIELGAFSKTPIFPSALGATLSFDSVATHRVNTMGFNLGNIVQLIESQNATEGFVGAAIMGRRPLFNLDPEMLVIATHDLPLRWRVGTMLPWSFQTDGAAYARIKLSGSNAQIINIQPGVRGDVEVQNVETKILIGSGADDYSLVFD